MSLTLQFIPYSGFENLSSDERIKMILSNVKKNKIVLLEGRLTDKEMAELFEKTMASVNKRFTGIEPAVVYPSSENKEFFAKVKSKLINFLLGSRSGFTIIGPANVVKEIKQDPDKIQLLTQ